MSDVQAPADGALSIDDAVNQLDAEPREEEQAQPEPEAPEPEEPEEAPEEVEEAEQAEEVEEPEVQAEAPHYWSAEAKARFAELPPELQAVVAENEAGRERAVQKAQREAVEARKAAEAEVQAIQQRVQGLDEVLQRAEVQFDRPVPGLLNAEGRPMRWAEVDWDAWFEEDYHSAAPWKAKFDAEQAALQRLTDARQKAEAERISNLRKVENGRIPEVIPDFADPKEGPRRIEATLRHLVEERGIPQDVLKAITAEELSIAYDAMRWREAQAKAQARPQPQRPPAARPVRPAAPAQTSTPQRQAEQARNRFAQTRSVDDAVALLNLRG